MHLRRAQPGDEEAVARVHVRSWQVAYRGFMPDDYLDQLTLSDRLVHYNFAESGPGWPDTILAVDEEEVCGFATIGPCPDQDKPDVGELRVLYVHPEWWSRGVGRFLIDDARHRLIQRGFAEAVLWVFVWNARAKRFYENDGWAPDGHRRLDEVFGIIVDEVRYARSLI